MARIAIDCDGVLANFAKAFIEKLRRYEPLHPLTEETWTTWDYGGLVSPALTKRVWQDIKATPNFWLGVDALSGVGDLARWLVSRAGHDVWICTSRAEVEGMTATKQTDVWLQSVGVRGVNNYLGVMTVPLPEEKWRVYEAMGIEWSLDDKAETVIDAGLIGTFEHHAYLLDQPWNRAAGLRNRVRSVGEYLDKIG